MKHRRQQTGRHVSKRARFEPTTHKQPSTTCRLTPPYDKPCETTFEECESSQLSPSAAGPLSPVTDGEEDTKRMSKTPSQLQAIIMSQFDMEILLKHKELRAIEEQMAKIRATMAQVSLATGIPSPFSDNETCGDDFLDVYLGYITELSSCSKKEESARPRRASAMKSHNRFMQSVLNCVFRRSDGELVQLVCPVCGKGSFSSAKLFVNHCRNLHKREFNSEDDAAYKCGHILTDITGKDFTHIKPLSVKKIPSSVNLAQHVISRALTAPNDNNNDMLGELLDEVTEPTKDSHLLEGEVEDDSVESDSITCKIPSAVSNVDAKQKPSQNSLKSAGSKNDMPPSVTKYMNMSRFFKCAA